MNTTNLPSDVLSRATRAFPQVLVVALGIALGATVRLHAADEAAAQKLLAESRAKETHAQELRAAAATASQKAADDQLEAAAEERDARILVAQALKLTGADANKQKAFHLRTQAHKLAGEASNMFVAARNSEQKAAQETRNAEELNKAVAQLKDQPSVAATLEAEAKDATTKSQADLQTANQAKYGAQSLEDRSKAAWAEAEKLDPETARALAPVNAKANVAQTRQAK